MESMYESANCDFCAQKDYLHKKYYDFSERIVGWHKKKTFPRALAIMLDSVFFFNSIISI